MSTNENMPLPDDVSAARAMAIRQSTMIGAQNDAWGAGAEFGLSGPAAAGRNPFSVYLHGLRRHWVLALVLGCVVGLLAGLSVYLGWGPQYRSFALLQVDTTDPMILQGPSTAYARRFTGDEYEIFKLTQGQLLKSPFVLTAALRGNDPQVVAFKASEGVNDLPWLQDEVRVAFPDKAQIMEISLTSSNRKRDVALVNTIVQAYLIEIVGKEKDIKGRRLDELDQAYALKDEEVRKNLNSLKELADKLGTTDREAASVKQQLIMTELAYARSNLQRLQFETRQSFGQMQAQQSLLDAVDDMEIADGEVKRYLRNDPAYRTLFQEQQWRMMDLASMDNSLRNPTNSPHRTRFIQDYQAVQAQVEGLAAEVREEIRAVDRTEFRREVQKLKAQSAFLAEQETELKAEVDTRRLEAQRLGEFSVDLEMMRTEIDNIKLLQGGIAEERDRLQVELRANSRIRKVQDAEEPQIPVNGVARVALSLVAMIFGLCLPGGLVVWWDSRMHRVNTASDVSQGLGVDVLGSIPVIPARIMQSLGSPTRTHNLWQTRLAESIDGVAARLLHEAERDQSRTILVTSATTGEGKTSLATQLAMSLARSNRRTVLVDFDLRRPAFDGVFGLPLQPGVCEALRGESNISEVPSETGAENLFVVTAGRYDRLSLTALANGAAGALLAKLREEYEFVVIDSSPILPVADTRFVSQHVDTVILSVFRDVSRADKIAAACDILDAFGVKHIEAVVTGPTESIGVADLTYEPTPTA
ncbi:MAG: AAA family ATPase [Candidatus Nealsonbacteria bacterium]|nr:AAA family ATPase [Candidatus Nealsonbacteria bacterium]